MVYLGLDIGTTGSKATAVREDGTVVASSGGEYKTIRTGDRHAEIDPREVWRTVKRLITEAAKKAGQPVRAIAVASLGESFVALDSKDHVLCNSLLYADVRGSEEIEDILSKIDAQQLFDITGMPINSMYTLNKLLWMKKHMPAVYGMTDKLFLFGDFIYYMLSGERAIDYSLASRTLFYDFGRKTWSDRVLDSFGIDAGKLSKPVPTGHVIGKVSAKMADELGLGKDVLLVTGGHDQICAALGAGVLEKGQCVDGIGTSECITVILDGYGQKESMKRNNFCIEPYVGDGQKERHVTLAFNATGASLLRWGRDTFKSRYAALERECPEKPTGLFVLPHFSGSGTPYMDPYSSGAILGLNLGTSRGEIYKACMEGLCFEMKLNAGLLSEMGTQLDSMICSGGGARSDMLLQIKSDIMGLPVKRLSSEESGTQGLAILCSVACEESKTLEEAAARFVRTEGEFQPRMDHHAAYVEKFGIYKKIYGAITGM